MPLAEQSIPREFIGLSRPDSAVRFSKLLRGSSDIAGIQHGINQTLRKQVDLPAVTRHQCDTSRQPATTGSPADHDAGFEYSPFLCLLNRRSEEHPSELQASGNLVSRLLLEKQNNDLK